MKGKKHLLLNQTPRHRGGLTVLAGPGVGGATYPDVGNSIWIQSQMLTYPPDSNAYIYFNYDVAVGIAESYRFRVYAAGNFELKRNSAVHGDLSLDTAAAVSGSPVFDIKRNYATGEILCYADDVLIMSATDDKLGAGDQVDVNINARYDGNHVVWLYP